MDIYKIEEVCQVKSSKRIYTSDYVKDGIPFYRGKEITEMSINKNITENVYISKEKFTEIDEKYGSPRVGDLLMTAVGTIGNVLMIEKTPIYFKDGNLIWFTDFIEHIVLPKYLLLLFKSDWFQLLLNKKGTIGSVQNALTIENVEKLEIPLPSIDEQKKILNEVENITKKISINYTLINKLEEYCKLLFHKWFLEFNFPDENGKPYKISGGTMYKKEGGITIPKGWKRLSLNKLINIMTETIDPAEYPQNIFKYYSIPSYDEKMTYCKVFGEEIKSSKYKVSENNLLVSKLNPRFKRIIYPMNVKEAICSTEFIVWNPIEKNMLEFLYVLAKSPGFTLYCTNVATGTSNSHKRVNPDYMSRYKISYNKKKVIQFNNIVKPLVQKISSLINENIVLKDYKELLVHKLLTDIF